MSRAKCHIRPLRRRADGTWVLRWTDELGQEHERRGTEDAMRQKLEGLAAHLERVAEERERIVPTAGVRRIVDPHKIDAWLTYLGDFANLLADRPADMDLARAATAARGLASAAERLIVEHVIDRKIEELEDAHRRTRAAIGVHADPLPPAPGEGAGESTH